MALITVLAVFYCITHFSINSNTENLINQNAEWKKIHNEWTTAFPHMTGVTIVVLSGEKPAIVDAVSAELETQLNTNNRWFTEVYSPASDPILNQHGLLYLDVPALESLTTKVAQAQPLLSAVRSDPNLRGLLGFITTALESGEALPESFNGFIEVMVRTAESMSKGEAQPVLWRDQLLDNGNNSETPYINMIFIKGRSDFDETLPNAKILASIRSSIDNLTHPLREQVNIRLTGQTPLDHGEIASAMESAQLAGTLATLILIVVLVLGVRSLKVILATYASMMVGLVWTTAYALLTVGEFNTISIVFLVMFIGLGVDFAIHLCLRYQEALATHNKEQALVFTARDLGTTIMLCALTSALGFLAYVPTKYNGLAELGIISGGGMAIALITSLTLIPAYFSLVKPPSLLQAMPSIAFMSLNITRHRKFILFAALTIAVLAAIIGRHAHFDYSTLALKDQHSEAMETFVTLQENNAVTAFSISYVAENAREAEVVKQRLLSLESVAEVITPGDYLPADQTEKLALLDDTSMILSPAFYTQRNQEPFTSEERLTIAQLLVKTIHQARKSNTQSKPVLITLEKLEVALNTLLNEENPELLLSDYEKYLVGDLELQVNLLEERLSVSTLGINDLSSKMRRRLQTDDARQLVSIIPRDDIRDKVKLETFVNQVSDIVPGATGRPVAERLIGDIVIESFQEAIVYAIIAISMILVVALRSIVDTILVFIPLLMTTLITLAVSVTANLPINMANVIVIPLIFGLGVDNGIHVVKRFHQSQTFEELITSSTPRAVFLSTLTTLGTFGALSFSSHQGIYSIGVLLTCALSALLFLTLIVLPAFLSVFSKPAHP